MTRTQTRDAVEAARTQARAGKVRVGVLTTTAMADAVRLQAIADGMTPSMVYVAATRSYLERHGNDVVLAALNQTQSA